VAAPHRLPSRRARTLILVAGLGVVVALGALTLVTTDTRPTPGPRREAVEGLTPAEGAVVTPQQALGIDLRDDLVPYRLVVDYANGDRREVPVDELEPVAALGQYTFRPGAGRAIVRFEPGVVRVTLTWASQAAPARPLGSLTWSFTVTA
jgi:hypothetical protein